MASEPGDQKRSLGPARRRAQISEGPLPPSPRGHGGSCRRRARSRNRTRPSTAFREQTAHGDARRGPTAPGLCWGVSCPFRTDATSTWSTDACSEPSDVRAETDRDDDPRSSRSAPTPWRAGEAASVRRGQRQRRRARGGGQRRGGWYRARRRRRRFVCEPPHSTAGAGPKAKFVVFPSESAMGFFSI